jgi:ubiquinone/menaquinone biosynthesis C-methylase UbiE
MTDWAKYAQTKDLRAVIDPADERGFKNRYINLLHHKILADAMGNSLKGKRVLDLGCGIGRFTNFLQSGGAEVVGVDSCRDMLALYGGSNKVCAPVTNLPFEDESFDMVLSVWVLQFLSDTDLQIAMEEIYRILKPNGTIHMIEQLSFYGYDNIYPRVWAKYDYVFNNKFKKIACRSIAKSSDKIIGFVRLGMIPEFLYMYLIRFHLLLNKYIFYLGNNEYIDYYMCFGRKI